MSPVLRDSRGEDEGTKVFFFFLELQMDKSRSTGERGDGIFLNAASVLSLLTRLSRIT